MNSLVGVTGHELAHTWFQFLLATNEAKHEWMDEGFTNYMEGLAFDNVMAVHDEHPNERAYKSYIDLALSGKEQPLSTHADRYEYNRSYSVAAYSKGSVFIEQLGYIIGDDNLKKAIKLYFKEWAFKHPTPNSIIRAAEKVSGLELDWYLMDFAQTTNTIDYGVRGITENNGTSTVILQRIGLMPMPLDIEVTFKDGTKQQYYIPLQMMRGEKPVANNVTILKDWAWAYPTYRFEIKAAKKDIKSVEIDPKNKMADVNKYNNKD